VITTNGTYPRSFVTQTFRNAKQVKVAKLSKISHILIQEEIETCGARTAYPSREHECKYGSCCSIVSFLRIVLLIIGCPFVVFIIYTTDFRVKRLNNVTFIM
jgi:hypothetical protein